MKIILFTHPAFLGHKSMPRYANMLQEGLKARDHSVDVWQPKGYFVYLSTSKSLKKWLGYIDQYLIFPIVVKRRLKKTESDALFVFADNALGPWIPLVSKRPHIVHCHDFLAQFSALNLIPENPTSFSGKLYQRFIRRGLIKARNFICVSKKTKSDLCKLLPSSPDICEVVYNGLNQMFADFGSSSARSILKDFLSKDIQNGFILHVGGNQWYKNKVGVIEIYKHWRKSTEQSIPLLLIGENISPQISAQIETSDIKDDILIIENADDQMVRLAYYGARVFLFPSLAEGFGWPIAEAMAAGCPVITTDDYPMSEVAGDAGFLIAKMPIEHHMQVEWLDKSSAVLETVVNLTNEELYEVVEKGLTNAKRFNPTTALDHIEDIYRKVLINYSNTDYI